MATSKLFAVVVPLVIIFSSLQIVTSKHAISASPAGSPYVNAPNMSSFFPSQAPPQWPDSGAFGPIPSSGEFVGKSSCTAAKPDVAILVLLQLFFLLCLSYDYREKVKEWLEKWVLEIQAKGEDLTLQVHREKLVSTFLEDVQSDLTSWTHMNCWITTDCITIFDF
ncbi:hypothetical protein Goklo_003956 [Gossypium klotzschianum]|uniref:Uncharacterized protein n=1 Tax=Gossypium klotzschianum TaxID=34286 RepID=A0A7J8VN60_9ROSI|nr:hypothetical protein [Gossypium klotzschianum]